MVLAGCSDPTGPGPVTTVPGGPTDPASSGTTTEPVPMEPTYRPPPGRATLSVRDGHVTRTAGIAVLFHPVGGAVRVTVGGAGAFRLCPADATGLPVSGAASSSWGQAWPATRCRAVVSGESVRLPTPPDAHVGVLLLSAGADTAISSLEVSYQPRDGFAAYRLGRVAATPTLLAAGTRAGVVTATVYEDCSGAALYRVGTGPERSTCRSTVTGTVHGRPSDGVLVRADGTAAATPLVVVVWPAPPG